MVDDLTTNGKTPAAQEIVVQGHIPSIPPPPSGMFDHHPSHVDGIPTNGFTPNATPITEEAAARKLQKLVDEFLKQEQHGLSNDYGGRAIG